MHIPGLLARTAFKYPEQQAILAENGQWTYRQWQAAVERKAAAFYRLGIRKGDHVATLFPNGNEVLESFFALLQIGAVIIPLNMRLSPEELRFIIDQSDAAYLMVSHEFLPLIRGIRDTLRRVRRFILSGAPAADGWVVPDEQDGPSPEVWPGGKIREDDTAFILYTAGTTGRPKGVMLSHRNLVWSVVNTITDTEFAHGWHILLIFPLYHVAAIVIMLAAVALGAVLVCRKTFDPRAVMEIMADIGIQKMIFPPTVWHMILRLPGLEAYDTSSVLSISSGSEAMPLETKKRLAGLFPQAKMAESYGMTESGATISTLKPESVLDKLNSVGRAFLMTEIRVAGEDDTDLPVGEVGEILVRGPHVMTGYYKNAAATEEALKGGWLHTGDLGRFDGDGFLYLVDRKKDMIISGGENIYPKEVEDVLYAHPKIAEAAVIGVPDPVWGQSVHAAIVLRENERMTAAEVIDFCRARIAKFKQPKGVTFLDRLPRSSVGKLLKRELRDIIKP